MDTYGVFTRAGLAFGLALIRSETLILFTRVRISVGLVLD